MIYYVVKNDKGQLPGVFANGHKEADREKAYQYLITYTNEYKKEYKKLDVYFSVADKI